MKEIAVQTVVGLIITSIIGLFVLLVNGSVSTTFESIASLFHGDRTVGAEVQAVSTQSLGSGLNMVDVSYGQTGTIPQIDVKLRNTGSEVAFIKRADIHVEQIWKLDWYTAGGAAGVSGNYDLNLPVDGAPYDQAIPVSQSVDANGVDRFTFTLYPLQELDPSADFIFLFSITLVYDEDNKSIASNDLLFIMGNQDRINPFDVIEYHGYDWEHMEWYIQESMEKCRATLLEVGKVQAARNPRLQEMIDSVS